MKKDERFAHRDYRSSFLYVCLALAISFDCTGLSKLVLQSSELFRFIRCFTSTV